MYIIIMKDSSLKEGAPTLYSAREDYKYLVKRITHDGKATWDSYRAARRVKAQVEIMFPANHVAIVGEAYIGKEADYYRRTAECDMYEAERLESGIPLDITALSKRQSAFDKAKRAAVFDRVIERLETDAREKGCFIDSGDKALLRLAFEIQEQILDI